MSSKKIIKKPKLGLAITSSNNYTKTESKSIRNHKLGLVIPSSSSYSSSSSAPITPTSKPRIPNRYEFIQILGQGAFGQVVKAIDKETNKLVAIKLQRFEDGDKIFQKEITNLKKIADKCDNLVCIIDSGLFYKKHYIVMDFIAGDTLTKYAEKNPKLIENTIKQLVFATKKLHKAGFAHMDIKPDNIMIDSNGKLYLVDLGLSCFTDSQCQGGTKKFLAPDLGFDDFSVKGRQQADVWAIGYSVARIMDKEEYAEKVSNTLERGVESDMPVPKMESKYLSQAIQLLLPIKQRMKIFKQM